MKKIYKYIRGKKHKSEGVRESNIYINLRSRVMHGVLCFLTLKKVIDACLNLLLFYKI